MNLSKLLTLLDNYDEVVTYILWAGDEVEYMDKSKQDMKEKLTSLSLLNGNEFWGITFSENLVEVMLDGPTIR